jgi:hypothetical protein
MPETISTTSNFNLPIDEIIEEALEMVGGEYVSGFEARSARRSLNLLMIDMQSRGYPLLHMEERTLSISAANGPTYDLASDVLAVLDVTITGDNQVDTMLGSMMWLDYFTLPNKAEQGKPSTYVFDRTSASPRMSFFVAPDQNYTIKYWVVRKHKDISASYQLLDINVTYLPAIVAGLAFFVGLKRTNFPLDRLAMIEQVYIDRLYRAFGEDRDRNDVQVYPSLNRPRG